MTEIKFRRIFKKDKVSHLEIKDLFESIFIGEILNPSKCLWIISPWLSNIKVLNNSSGKFDSLNSSWGHREISLFEVLIHIINCGTQLIVAIRNDENNEKFIRQLEEYSIDHDLHQRISIIRNDNLHNKGILGDNYYLNGSMNITYNGLNILDEQITFTTDQAEVAQAKLAFNESYGGKI